ncbi:hypothetical protein F5884DRAFT_66995 [Xylogone sp. PMI_703]|nr:hypothetical protein F5884DRAFT_66995 [Xylogone sp. PMI_703]
MDGNAEYTPIALGEDEKEMAIPQIQVHEWKPERSTRFTWIFVFLIALFTPAYIMIVYKLEASILNADHGNHSLLPPQSFFPEIPTVEVEFEFPTLYGDDGVLGDQLWKEMMPIGAGFVRVPNPRQYDMPQSKPLLGDSEDAEIYSVSMTHQLHCLAVLRDVIVKYSRGDKSRFAGGGHEYHCLDYIRQSILCAGDTTLDYANAPDETGRSSGGFSGAGSKHECRDWNVIRELLIENRSGDKQGIF